MPQTLKNLVQADAKLSHGGDVEVRGLTSDSRKVKEGFVFAALPGTKVDGTKFIAQALALGAAAIICQTGSYKGEGLIIECDNPRRLLALMAARFYDGQPDTVVAVTGTNGKTSVAVFVRQIWAAMGFRSASLGTIGVVGPEGSEYLAHTTPDPVQLAQLAAKLRDDHVQHLAIEASSHGLSQNRLDGLRLTAAGFTNLTRDHLDYHATLEDYFAAKMRLFDELLPEGSAAVINMDSPYGAQVLRLAEQRGLIAYTVGSAGTSLMLLSATRSGLGQQLKVQTKSGIYDVALPLVGEFQTSNALVAAGLVIASGGEEVLTLHALESLKGAKGRLELVGVAKNGASVFVDYAHTPDALENAILALQPYVTGKLSVVFGCGGDRDKGKRPLMGEVANRLAARVYVTDDNPRTEASHVIRAEILSAAKSAIEIPDRATAIAQAINDLGQGDILLVAGKGHEEGQIIGQVTIPFSDHDAVSAALRGEKYHGE
jgi:UDP-N-acetylmuramoyl-L-alanyl-D-glutamate--2,6-diaminopimelate ligase